MVLAIKKLHFRWLLPLTAAIFLIAVFIPISIELSVNLTFDFNPMALIALIKILNRRKKLQ